MKQITSALVAALAVAAITIGGALGLPLLMSTSASAAAPCVPAAAYDEVIHHDAVTHVVHHDAVTHVVHHDAVTHVVHHDAVTHQVTVVDQEATPEVWANFSPNHEQGPFEDTPTFPTDARGTWHLHDKIPGGHEGPDGVYQRGHGNGDWFYRHNATAEVSHQETVVDQEAYDETVVDTEAYDETVVDQEAYDETIHHDAVTCPPTDEPTPPVTPPTDTPVPPTPTQPSEPNPPAAPAPPVKHSTPAVPTVVHAGL